MDSEATSTGLSPSEAAFLGGKATLSTHQDGRAKRRLVFNVFAQGLSTSAPFISIAAFLALVLNFRSSAVSEAMGSWSLLPWGLLAAGVIAFFAPVLWGLRPETVEMSPEVLKITRGSAVTEMPWTGIRQLRATLVASYVSRRVVLSRPAVLVRTDSATYTMKWWRFTIDDQKQFFNYAASRLLPSGTPVIDDLHWLPADKASHPAVSSEWVRQYHLVIKVGMWMMLIGLVLSVGFFVGVPLVGAVGSAMLFIGMFAAVLGWSALSEEKKKRGQA